MYEGVQHLLEFVQIQRLRQHHLDRKLCGVEIVDAIGDRDDGPGVPPADFQVPNLLRGVGAVAVEVHQCEAEAAVRERVERLGRGRRGDALVPTAPEKPEQSRPGWSVDFDHKGSHLTHCGALN